MSSAIALVHGGGGGALSPPSPSGDGSRPQVQRASLKLYDSSPATGGRKLEGSLGSIDFQFNPNGSGAAPASASVTSFASNGTPGAIFFQTGDATGSLPGNLSFDNGTAQNELTQAFTYGTNIQFDVTLSGPAVGGSAPTGSTFSFTLYDTNGTPYSTGPGGASVTIDINPNGTTTAGCHSNTFLEGRRDARNTGLAYSKTTTYAPLDPFYAADPNNYFNSAKYYKYMEWK